MDDATVYALISGRVETPYERLIREAGGRNVQG